MLFSAAPNRRRYLLVCFVLVSFLGAAFGGPIDTPREGKLIARQATTTTTQATATRTTTTSAQASTTQSASQSTTSSAVTSVTTTTTRTTTTTSSQTTTTASATSSASITSGSSTSSSTTSTTTSTSASATSTSSSSNIFSKSSPYFKYTIGVLVVIGVFGLLLLVLCIRFIIQKFSEKPQPPPVTSNAGEWRYSQDTELHSPGMMRNLSVNAASARHKDLGSEMGEREAFLSTESVTLYPATKSPGRYSDDDSSRRHSRTLSTGSQSTATPYANRRPGSMTFLHSPPATHPAFIVDRAPGSDHGYFEEQELRTIPQAAPQMHEPEARLGPRSMPSLIAARASHSDPYRQHTLLSSAGVSRNASTASFYSQPSAIHTEAPPLPVLPLAYAQPQPHMSSDVSAALFSMQTQNPSTDTIHTDEMGTTAPPTTKGHEHPSALRQTPGRMGLGGQAPTSIHSHADLFFGHSHSR